MIKGTPGEKARMYIALAFVVGLLVYCVTYSVLLWQGMPHDEYRRDLTLEEAQELVIFSICVPTYVPPKARAEPTIDFFMDDARVPEVTDIRILYDENGPGERLFEVIQRWTPDPPTGNSLNEGDRDSAKIVLMNWMYPWRFFSTAGLESAMKRADMPAQVQQSRGRFWRQYQIVDPPEYRSTMSEWVADNVEYRILGFLPPEELEKVTRSLLWCPQP